MAGLTKFEAARRAGVEPEYIDRLLTLGLLRSDEEGRFTKAQARRAQLVRTLDGAGIPLDGLAEGVKSGELSLDFVESDLYEHFAGLTDETFAEASARTRIPMELLIVMREAIGLAQPAPDDRVREDEQQIIPFIETQLRLGFRQPAIERLLRVTGESMRRTAEQESDWWRTEVIEPAFARGLSGRELFAAVNEPNSRELEAGHTTTLLAMHAARRAQTWTNNIIAGLEAELARAGLFSQAERVPAICFLDITGYTRLTQERGDAAAAGLAQQLNRVVQRAAVAHAGKPVKWLGDGVMLYFSHPGQAVDGALEMVGGVVSAGLPPAHVGVHAGPVLFQEGDYFGTTVNVAARIAEYARPGEVLVSQAVVDAADTDAVTFAEVGPVELKGVAGALRLHVARRAPTTA